METTGANGSLHSSYLLVDGLDAHSVISSLSVAIHQQPPPTEKRQQTTTSDADDAAASSVEAQEAEAAEGDDDIRAQIYIDCHLVGTVTLAGSFKTMVQSSHLRVVWITRPWNVLDAMWCRGVVHRAQNFNEPRRTTYKALLASWFERGKKCPFSSSLVEVELASRKKMDLSRL